MTSFKVFQHEEMINKATPVIIAEELKIKAANCSMYSHIPNLLIWEGQVILNFANLKKARSLAALGQNPNFI
jgi:hypothetical protein